MNKVVKPTSEQNVEIQRRLRQRYPHMGTEMWLANLKKRIRTEIQNADPVKKGQNLATRKIIDQARRYSDLSDADLKKLGIGNR